MNGSKGIVSILGIGLSFYFLLELSKSVPTCVEAPAAAREFAKTGEYVFQVVPGERPLVCVGNAHVRCWEMEACP